MKFDSFGDFLAMGHHGLFVWSAYGICFAVLAINVALPLMARRRYLQQEARRLRWESQK
jgi:heme exporter protein D